MFAALAVLALGPDLAAQQVFPTDVELVAVDVLAVDSQGRPATDLAPLDFVVTVGGRPRRVVAAQLVRYGTPATAPAEAPPPRAEAITNQGAAPGRMIVLVPDLESLSPAGARAVSDAAIRFLGLLSPQDRVALVAVPSGPKLDFTTDHAQAAEALRTLRGTTPLRSDGFYNVSLAEAFARYSAMGDRRLWCAAWEREVLKQGVSSSIGPEECPDDPVLDAEARRVYDTAQASTAMTMGALLQLLRALAQVEGPKTVVFIGQGLVTGASGGELGGNRRLAEIAEAAAAARTGVYTIQLERGLLEAMDVTQRAMPQTTMLDQQLRADGLEAIAGHTGGALLRTTANPDVALARVATETQASWLLSFEPEPGDRDGRPHAIRVQVKRKGVELRARPQFVVKPKDAEPVSAESLARRALDAPLLASDVPLTLATFVLGQGEDKVLLVLAAEVGLGADLADAAAVGYSLRDGQGRLAASAVETGRLDSMRAPGGDALYYLATVELAPGPYTVRLAAAAPSGRRGSVERALEARLQSAHGLRLSDLLVSEPGRRASGQALSVDGRLLGRTAHCLLEIHGSPGPPSAQYELRTPGSALARLVSNAMIRPTTQPGSYSAEASLDLGSLEPGRYELHAVASLPDGSEAGRQVRPLELLVSAATRRAEGSEPGYESVVSRYASGDGERAVAELADWQDRRLRAEVRRIAAQSLAARRAALMLYSDAARLARRRGQSPELHESLAREIAGQLKDDYARRWWEAMAGLAQAESRWDDALAWAERGLREFPQSAELHLVVGSIEETFGVQQQHLLPEAVTGRISSQTEANIRFRREIDAHFEKARRSLRAALASDPSFAEARLRLGRVAYRRGETSEARVALEETLAQHPKPDTAFLAYLQLGRLEEDEGRLDDAARSYAAAVALDPDSQSARLALSHVRQRQGDTSGARAEVEAVLGSASRRRRADPLWRYPWGTSGSAEDRLEALRREARP